MAVGSNTAMVTIHRTRTRAPPSPSAVGIPFPASGFAYACGIPVAVLVRMVAAGTPVETILEEYPQLEEDDVREALRFAAANVDQRVVPLDQSA